MVISHTIFLCFYYLKCCHFANHWIWGTPEVLSGYSDDDDDDDDDATTMTTTMMTTMTMMMMTMTMTMMTVDRVKELSSTNEKLRAQLSEKERGISALQMTVSSLESRLSSLIAREAGTPPVLAPETDQDQDSASETLHRIACQLIADGEELEAVGQSVDQVLVVP